MQQVPWGGSAVSMQPQTPRGGSYTPMMSPGQLWAPQPTVMMHGPGSWAQHQPAYLLPMVFMGHQIVPQHGHLPPVPFYLGFPGHPTAAAAPPTWGQPHSVLIRIHPHGYSSVASTPRRSGVMNSAASPGVVSRAAGPASSVISTPSSRQALVMVIPTTTEARGERRGEKTSPQRSPTAVIACTPSPTKVLDDPSASGSPGRRAPSSAVAARSTLGGIAPSAVKSLNVEVPDGLSVKKRREPTIAEAGSDKAREEAAGKKAEEEQARKREEAAKTAKAEEEARKVKLAEEARRAPEAQEEDKYRKLAEEASNREEETKARPAPKSVHEALALGDWVAFEKLLQTHPDKQAVLSKPVENPIICQVARGDGAAWFVRAVMRVDPWSVITQDSEHRGAIHIAANLGDFESCKALLDLKPERVKGPQLVSQLDKKKMHALHYAVLSGNEELVELMVAHGGERAAGVPNGQGMYPLHMACSKGMARAVAALCKIEGSDKAGSAVNGEGETPLHLATQEGFDDVVRVLLEHGVCPPNAQDNKGWTALHLAIVFQMTSTAELLSPHTDPALRDADGKTPADLWAEHGVAALPPASPFHVDVNAPASPFYGAPMSPFRH